MSANLSGGPGVKDSITELGFIPGGGNLGIICTQVIAKRGERGKEYLIGTWADYLNVLGGLHADDDTPLLIREGLNRGAKFRITRAFHYTDPDQISSVDGTKATASILVAAVLETLSSFSFTITGGTLGAGVNKVTSVLVNGVNVLGVAVDWGTSHAATATAVAAQITSFSSTPNYTASALGAVVTVEAAAGTGATPNGFVTSVVVGGDVTVTGSPGVMAGGVTAVAGGQVDFDALEVGDGYNGSVITITESADNNPNHVDIAVALTDSLLPFKVTGIEKATTTAPLIAVLNRKLKAAGCQVVITAVTTALVAGSDTLVGGVQDTSMIVDADVVGTSAGKTGWFSFDEVVDSMRLWNIGFPNPAVNQGVADYCASRRDMRGLGRFPLGLSIQGMNDYRDGTGAYSHQPIDSYYMDLFVTDANITNPADAQDVEYLVSAAGHMAASRTKADDNNGPWWSMAEEKYNKLSGINSLPINLGSPGNALQWDVLYEKGVNAVINDPVQKIIIIGNRSTLLNKTSLLSKSNIIDGVVFMAREIKGIARRSNFKPNDVRMFNELYRRVRPFITNTLIPGRAIEGAGQNDGEGLWWHWIGDQLAKDNNDLKWNNKLDVDAGKYKVRFAFKPIASNEYIALDLAPADSVTILNISVLTDPFNS